MSAMPLASSDPAGMQYAFILALKPDGSLVLALFGGVFNMNDFAAAVERALHYTYFLEGAAKSFHIDFESYTSMVKALGHAWLSRKPYFGLLWSSLHCAIVTYQAISRSHENL